MTSNAGSDRPGVAVSPVFAAAVLASAGAVLRLWQYLANSSLWIDEAALARNIVDRAPAALLQPLDYAQVAPPAFLLTEKALVTLLGNSEWTLRLFPLACGLLGLWLFWRTAAITLTGWAVPYAVGLFSLGTPLVYFSSQVKQYATDVAASVAVMWAVLWLWKSRPSAGRTLAVAGVGAIVVWFSHPVVFVLAGAGAALSASAMAGRRRAGLGSLLAVGASWALSAGLASAWALRSVSSMDRAYLDWFWGAGMVPSPPWALDDALWLWRRLTWLFGAFATGVRRSNGGLGYPWSAFFAVLSIAGFAALWRRQREAALLLIAPVLATLAGAALHVYPFTGRGLSFLLPVFLIATAAGADAALTHWPVRLRWASPAVLAFVMGSPAYAALAALPPERTEELRPVLEAVAARRQPADAIYVFYGAGQAFMYYAPRFGLTPPGVVMGRCSMTDMRVYVQDVDQFRGRPRVWVVATHARMDAIELDAITGYLSAIGRRLDSIEVRATSNSPSTGAYAYLYDLSNVDRLATSTADTYPVSAARVDEGVARWGCYGTQSAVR